jgi:hypothetical protein
VGGNFTLGLAQLVAQDLDLGFEFRIPAKALFRLPKQQPGLPRRYRADREDEPSADKGPEHPGSI